jgi:hypothetical protein
MDILRTRKSKMRNERDRGGDEIIEEKGREREREREEYIEENMKRKT